MLGSGFWILFPFDREKGMKYQNHFGAIAKRLVVLTSLLAPFLLSIGAKAQWKVVLDESLAPSSYGYGNIGYVTIYFLDLPGPPRIGFVSTDGPAYKTTDGGFTWHVTSGIVKDVWGWTFKDSLTGWTATQPVYKTTDGGETWFPSPTPNLSAGPWDIYYDSVSDGLFLDADNDGLPDEEYVSWDEGQTWQLQREEGQTGFAFANGDTGIECGHPVFAIPIIRTTDAGHTWQTLTCDSFCYHPLAIQGTSTFFMFTPLGTFMRSDDAGLTWRNIYAFPYTNPVIIPPDPYGTGDIWFAGSCIYGDVHDLYVSTLNGCYHSTDTGHTWNYLCGMPSVSVTGISKFYAKGHIVFLQTINPPNNSTGNWQDSVWRLNLDSMQYFTSSLNDQFPDGTKRSGVSAGSNVTVNYVPHTDTLVGIDSVMLAIHYDSASLALTGIKIPSPWGLRDSSLRGNELYFLLTDTSAEPLPSPILQLSFGTFLTSSLSAKVYLDSVHLYGHRLNCDCAVQSILSADTSSLVASSIDSVEIDFTGCGDSLILAAMQSAPPFSIVSIQPNPASSIITVTVSGVREPGSGIEYEMFDALGQTVLTQHTASSTADTQDLDVSSIPSGIYFLRLSQNGYVQSSEVAIER